MQILEREKVKRDLKKPLLPGPNKPSHFRLYNRQIRQVYVLMHILAFVDLHLMWFRKQKQCFKLSNKLNWQFYALFKPVVPSKLLVLSKFNFLTCWYRPLRQKSSRFVTNTSLMGNGYGTVVSSNAVTFVDDRLPRKLCWYSRTKITLTNRFQI